MGMDIYFLAYDREDKQIGERQNLRCREIYHTVNRWCESQKRPTPDNGERVSLDATAWKTLGPKFVEDIAGTCVNSGDSEEVAMATGREWLDLIWPPGTERVEYWFTN